MALLTLIAMAAGWRAPMFRTLIMGAMVLFAPWARRTPDFLSA
jgi:hypothetical protein